MEEYFKKWAEEYKKFSNLENAKILFIALFDNPQISFDGIMDATSKYLASKTGDQKKFQKNGENWLRDETWRETYCQPAKTPTPSLPDPEAVICADSHSQLEFETLTARLRLKLGEATYNSWLKPMKMRFYEGQNVLAVPASVIKQWIISNHLQEIRGYWQELTGQGDINIVVEQIT